MATSYAGTQRKRLAIVGVTAIVVVAGVTGVVLFNQSSSVSSPGAVTGAPGAPTSLSAIRADVVVPGVGTLEEAKFSWNAPTDSGSSAITEYDVSSNAGGGCTAKPTVTTCTAGSPGGPNHGISGYTWTVTAKNAQGTSDSSVAVNT